MITYLLVVIASFILSLIEKVESGAPPPPSRRPDITDGMSRREFEEYMEWKNGRDVH